MNASVGDYALLSDSQSAAMIDRIDAREPRMRATIDAIRRGLTDGPHVHRWAEDVGLLAEMADPQTGELIGNIPQAFSHVGLVNTAWRLTQGAG